MARVSPPAPAERDQALSVLAGAQRGLATRSQLIDLGFSGSAIDRRVARGSLHPILPGVYAVGHETLAPLAAEMAGLMYVGDDCVLSHASAGALWDLVPSPPAVTVTRVGGCARRHGRLVVHRVAALDIGDVALRRGLPVTAPARTLIDLAAVVGSLDLERALAEVRVSGRVTDQQLHRAIHRARGRPGVARLRALLRVQRGPAITRSEAERALRRLVAAGQLPEPVFNAQVHGLEVDAVWHAARLVVEVDGYVFHGHRAAFERDRRRDQQLAAAGYTVVRITWRQLRDEPIAVAVRLAQALARALARAGDAGSVAD